MICTEEKWAAVSMTHGQPLLIRCIRCERVFSGDSPDLKQADQQAVKQFKEHDCPGKPNQDRF